MSFRPWRKNSGSTFQESEEKIPEKESRREKDRKVRDIFCAEVEKAKKDIQPYAFFSWIETYCATRTAKSNIMKEDVSIASSEEEEIDDEVSPIPTKKKMKNNRMKQREVEEEKDQEELKIIRDLHSTIKQNAQEKENESPDNVYGRYVASEIGQFNELEKSMVKHEVEGVIFKYKMLKYKAHQILMIRILFDLNLHLLNFPFFKEVG